MESLTVVLLAVVALGLAVAAGAALITRRTESSTRLRRLEAKVDRLLAEAGLDVDPDLDLGPVRELVAAGETVRAVRAYRQATGASLVAAKEAVDQMGQMGSGRP